MVKRNLIGKIYKLILNHFNLLEPLMAKPYLINQ